LYEKKKRKRDKVGDDYNGVLFTIGQKASLKDNHSGVIDKNPRIHSRQT